jgi:Ca2+-binding RTX toxin-like protein
VIATSAILGLAALAPPNASAVEVKTQQIAVDVIFITADASFANRVGVTWVTSPSGSTDLVIGDTAAGIPDPIPSQCARVDPDTVRCLADIFTKLDAELGPGPDSLSVLPIANLNTGFISIKLSLGPGRDRAVDNGQTRDVWDGGRGRDVLSSGPGNDRVSGGPQNDIIDCGPGDDVGIGGPGRLDLGRNCETVRH